MVHCKGPQALWTHLEMLDLKPRLDFGMNIKYKSTFKAVTVSSEITFEGYVRHDGKLFVEATRPGGGSRPAGAFQGTFTRQTETNGDWRIEGE